MGVGESLHSAYFSLLGTTHWKDRNYEDYFITKKAEIEG